MPDGNVLNGIIELHKAIFGTSDDLINKMKSKHQLLVITAMDGKKVIGYKLGYEIDDVKFFSWLGGVDPIYRNQGIAYTLMEKQHKILKRKALL
jgi:predicted GNAT superfamily acetyltransferase